MMKQLFLSSLAAAALLAAAGGQGRADTAIDVGLWDRADGKMGIILSAPEAKAGKVTFNVANTSKDQEHEFLIIRGTKPLAGLPYDETDKELEEEYLDIVGEVEGLKPGQSGTMTAELAAGDYYLLCNLKGHVDAGMTASLKVVP